MGPDRHDSSYPEVVRNLWILNPDIGARQAIALVIAWLHGCLGIYFWLRPKPWFSRAALFLYTGAILVPVLALLGFAEAGRDIAEAPERFGQNPAAAPAGFLPMAGPVLYALFGGLLAATVAARFIRSGLLWSRRVRVFYPNDQVATVPLGFSVLEASRIAGIPHISVCGGRGRCSTCRVRVLEGHHRQPPPTASGARHARAHQGRPQCAARLPVPADPRRVRRAAPVDGPQRRDLPRPQRPRPGTGAGDRGPVLRPARLHDLAERRLPFDTVFILNRYFEAVGESVEDAGGYIDKFIGDGVLALFGLRTTPSRRHNRRSMPRSGSRRRSPISTRNTRANSSVP